MYVSMTNPAAGQPVVMALTVCLTVYNLFELSQFTPSNLMMLLDLSNTSCQPSTYAQPNAQDLIALIVDTKTTLCSWWSFHHYSIYSSARSTQPLQILHFHVPQYVTSLLFGPSFLHLAIWYFISIPCKFAVTTTMLCRDYM